MPRKNAVQHGTPHGYKKHLKDPEWGEPCAECRIAHADEVAEYRARKKRDRTAENERRTARGRALARLEKKFPKTYQVYLTEELNKIGASR